MLSPSSRAQSAGWWTRAACPGDRGDHAVTYPVLRAIGRRHPGLTILHIDAHPDLYDTFEGNRLSHACPFARVMEEGLATRLVQVGIRTMNGHQHEQARRFASRPSTCVPGLPGPAPGLGACLRLNRSRRVSTRRLRRRVASRAGRVERARCHRPRARPPPLPPSARTSSNSNPSQDPLGLTACVAAKLVKELAGGCWVPRLPRARSLPGSILGYFFHTGRPRPGVHGAPAASIAVPSPRRSRSMSPRSLSSPGRSRPPRSRNRSGPSS